MACVTSCPSGVQYDRLIESTRAEVEQKVDRSRSERLLRSVVFRVLPYPRRMRAALALQPLGRRLPVPGSLKPLLDVAPPWRSSERPPAVTAAQGASRARVGLLEGCVQRAVFGNVNAATARVLAADGYEVVAPRRQACCGALSVHAGRLEEGLERARRLIDVFEQAGVDLIATNAAGCGSNLKDYGTLLAEDPRYSRARGSLLGQGPGRLGDPRGIGTARRATPATASACVPGFVPSPPRAGSARCPAHGARRRAGSRGARACRAGALLWQCRDLQPRAAAGGRRARRAARRPMFLPPRQAPMPARIPAVSSR